MRNIAGGTFFIRAPKLNQLNILSLLADNSNTTQAELADRCRLSVAMVNNYMKELCGTGLLEYHRKSSKSVTYHLTAAGRQHIQALQCELLDEMVGLFAEAKERVGERILSRRTGSVRRVVLMGSGHLAELAFHALEKAGISVLGICDDDQARSGQECCGRELVHSSQIRYLAPDAVVVASPARNGELCRDLSFLSERGIQLITLDGTAAPATTDAPPPALAPSRMTQ
jgi:DNA-binding MarR family transcriptional regulator